MPWHYRRFQLVVFIISVCILTVCQFQFANADPGGHVSIIIYCIERGGTVLIESEDKSDIRELEMKDASSEQITLSRSVPGSYLYTFRMKSSVPDSMTDNTVYTGCLEIELQEDGSTSATFGATINGKDKVAKIAFHNVDTRAPRQETEEARGTQRDTETGHRTKDDDTDDPGSSGTSAKSREGQNFSADNLQTGDTPVTVYVLVLITCAITIGVVWNIRRKRNETL